MSRHVNLRVFVLCAALAGGLSGQESRGGIAGRVIDPQGAVMPGTKVTITNTATNEVRHATTNATGYYEVNFLEPSRYSMTAEAAGFKKTSRGGIELNVASRLEIDLRMEVAFRNPSFSVETSYLPAAR